MGIELCDDSFLNLNYIEGSDEHYKFGRCDLGILMDFGQVR